MIRKIESARIFYFSGTGNAKRSAQWITDELEQEKVKTELKNLSQLRKVDKQEIQCDLLGFCYPTHGFNAPPIVLKFLFHFPRTKDKTKVFVLNTRAGMKMHKFFTFGLSGIALLLPAIMLRLKGYRIVGYRPIDLPSNWISVHPGLKEKVIKSMFTRCKHISISFIRKILAGKKEYRGLYDLLQDLLISPISVGYYFFGRFMLAKTFIATQDCDNCGVCYNSCPVNAIKVKWGKPYWKFKCESCMHCMNSCPQRAIETPHLFTFFLWWFALSLLPFWLLQNFTNQFAFIEKYSDFTYSILQISSGLLIIFLGYLILHFLMKFRFICKLIQFTSLTHLKNWRRYKAPK